MKDVKDLPKINRSSATTDDMSYGSAETLKKLMEQFELFLGTGPGAVKFPADYKSDPFVSVGTSPLKLELALPVKEWAGQKAQGLVPLDPADAKALEKAMREAVGDGSGMFNLVKYVHPETSNANSHFLPDTSFLKNEMGSTHVGALDVGSTSRQVREENKPVDYHRLPDGFGTYGDKK